MIDTMTSARARIGKRDVAIASVLSALGILLMLANVQRMTDSKPPTPDEQSAVSFGGILPVELAIPMFLLVTVPLLWRRAAPLAAVRFAFAGLVVNELLIGTDLLRCGVVLPTAFFFAFTTASRLESREARMGLALSLGLVVVDIGTSFGAPEAVVFSGMAAAVWGIGRVVQSRHRMAGELEARTAELREARDERARLEVSTDRSRLSSELDELLQRRLGELASLADAGARPADPAATTAMLVDIERESRRTLDEMREIVGVLRDDDHDAPVSPQPTLTHLEAMLVRAKGAGARLSVEGDPRVLPAGVELSAYRIVEHLLAGLEDSPGVEVCIRFGDDALEITVAGPARRRVKESIEHARERVTLERGTLEATIRRGRAEAVVSLPVVSVA